MREQNLRPKEVTCTHKHTHIYRLDFSELHVRSYFRYTPVSTFHVELKNIRQC